MAECRKCGGEIKWKHSYKEFLKLKKENPDYKNIPLNLDGTQHTCEEGGEKFDFGVKEKIAEQRGKDNGMLRMNALRTATMYVESQREYTGAMPLNKLKEIVKIFEHYILTGEWKVG